MKYFSLPILLLIWLVPNVATATEHTTGKLNEDVWYLDTVVMINGSNLQGPMPSQSKLCFAPEALKQNRLCFTANHPNVTKWTTSNITFIPPKNAPPNGIVILAHPAYKADCFFNRNKQRKCSAKLVTEYIEIASYKAHPHITKILSQKTGKFATSFLKGNTYEIQGYRMGDFGMGIFAGVHRMPKTDIERWTHDSIIFTASKDYPLGTEVMVHNGAGKGNKWVLERREQTDDALPEELVQTGPTPTTQTTQTGATSASGTLVEQQTEVAAQSGAQINLNDEQIFDDVPLNHKYSEAIAWATNVGLVQGYEDNTFRPQQTVTRAELIKVLVAANTAVNISAFTDGEELPFWDVDEEAWYAPYIRYAYKAKVVEGYKNGSFRPGEPVNFAEGLKMMYGFLQIPTLDPKTKDLWYARYLEHAIVNDVLFNFHLDPDAGMRRQDVVWMTWKLLLFKSKNTYAALR